jgi:hypothetical protein
LKYINRGKLNLYQDSINLLIKNQNMKQNMGTTDRIIRLILAILMTGLYLGKVVTGTFGLILVILSAVFLLTSLIKFCPLYLPFGIKTNRKK